MAHYPLNHHLRPVYRFFAGLAGLYLALFGIIGVASTWGDGFFHRGADWVLGLRTNPAAAWLYTIIGVLLLLAVLVGGNFYHHVTLIMGWVLAAFGVLIMAVIQTDANVLNASMVNVIVTIVLGVVALCAGLYGKVGSADAARTESAAAHG
ncbi:hypothetical protein GCM10010172_25370 [Paractinoplanes ferrugineus]|uniref:DUF4383 domain-containing protein n=1 Tax=Paractinoplanes ferrugineus TaxID=113564 RepID=A0A919MAC4_9ACTN|nr:DUF4383 domain-containing protein [Actinoplanes ferrugineus]GIE08553.1 hypothetical protein Afe05nite_03930 [Actinoplanes ferrugineus]